jgi:hypothetical protein
MKSLKNTKHSRTLSKTPSKTNSKTQKKSWDYDVDSKSTYDKLFKALNHFGSIEDWEGTHLIEDDILHKFINEICNNNYKTKKEIIKTARMINKNVLTKKYPKWYA